MQFKHAVRPCLWVVGLLALILSSQVSFAQQYAWEGGVRDAIQESRFADAAKALDALDVSGAEQTQKEWYYELMRRIRIEFRQTESEIKEELAKRGYDNSDAQMREWESKRYLEMRPIDGVRWYFKHAVDNLERLAPEIRATRPSGTSQFRLNNCAQMIKKSDGKGKLTLGQANVFHCVATLPANAIPAGEVVRYWAPFPREWCERQQDVKLLSHNADVCEIAPKEDLQRIVYMEKTTVKDKPTVFDYSFQTTSYAQYYSQEYLEKTVKPYDVDSDLYKEFTAEYLPHMIKTDAMKAWADEIVGDEKNPVKIVSKLFDAIDERFPWASSNEYGTMFCIPEYVIREGHGDCGMLTLTLVSALRCEGVPAKWQSGWTMKPDGECGMHDWGEIYYEGVGWVPVDMSYGLMTSDDPLIRNIYKSALDQYRLIINDSVGCKFTPEKKFFRSEPVDCQAGEMEWNGGNLYFNEWSFEMTVDQERLD
ncbi:MAG: transglutaminase domain-containing protein [Thermoguttaceae bacterium]|nr:transglutaminase domain-containing protein [Thermoguttaceae bacterium]